MDFYAFLGLPDPPSSSAPSGPEHVRPSAPDRGPHPQRGRERRTAEWTSERTSPVSAPARLRGAAAAVLLRNVIVRQGQEEKGARKWRRGEILRRTGENYLKEKINNQKSPPKT